MEYIIVWVMVSMLFAVGNINSHVDLATTFASESDCVQEAEWTDLLSNIKHSECVAVMVPKPMEGEW